MKKTAIRRIILSGVIFMFFLGGYGQSRKEISIPNIKDYITLKCDFHMHTVFSDGQVWPVVRVEEAWAQGLDAISITDHLEYRPNKKEIEADHNRSYNLALGAAEKSGLLLVKGTEITKDMPPGHLNALFIKDANPIENNNPRKALKAAHEQGAFVFWNHPGWVRQAPDSAIWYEEHTYLHNQDWFQGMEIFNSTQSYGNKVYGWAYSKNLAVLANSDIHGLVGLKYDIYNSHRPMTLVFAKEKSLEALKEALFARRTAAYFNDTIIGHKEHLTDLFNASLKISGQKQEIRKNKTVFLQIYNHSDIDYELFLIEESDNFQAPGHIILKAHKTTIFAVRGLTNKINITTEINIPYRLRNMIALPGKNLEVNIELHNIR
ncbi:Sb-PDE family phosphodiesterase [Bacteroidota bacterium]